MTDNTNNTVADWLRQETERRQQLAEARPANKAAIFGVLAAVGITSVVVSFDGSGDSGQIEHLAVQRDDEPAELPLAGIEWLEPMPDGDRLRHRSVTIAEAIENLVYELLEESHDGWENNDGAFGEFTFDVKERSITLGYNERFSDSTYYEYVF